MENDYLRLPLALEAILQHLSVRPCRLLVEPVIIVGMKINDAMDREG